MLEPVTVWMVELKTGSTLHEVKGILTLGEDALRFVSPANGTEVRIPYERARSARRLRMSPVLLVRWRDEADRTSAFYFAPPPPLVPPDGSDTQLPRAGIFGPLGGRPPSKRRQRRENASYLTMRSGPLKPTMVAWADEVRTRIAASRGG
jgi:hypothetical protein